VTNDELVAGVRTVADVVQTTLGPFGANKLLIQQDGTVTATASATELLERFDVTDPAVTLLETAATGFRRPVRRRDQDCRYPRWSVAPGGG